MPTNQTQIIIPKLPEPTGDELPKFPSYLYEIKLDCGMSKKDIILTQKFELTHENIQITLKGGNLSIYMMNVLSLEIRVLLNTPELTKKITTIDDYFKATGMM